MATSPPCSSSPHLLQFPLHSPSSHHPFFSDLTFSSPFKAHLSLRYNAATSVFSIPLRFSSRAKCFAKSTEEDRLGESETLNSDGIEAGDDAKSSVVAKSGPVGSPRIAVSSSGDFLSLGIREPVYEVVEVKSNGMVSTRKIHRRQLLKSSGLRPRDIRSVDPSLWLTNSMPSLLERREGFSRCIVASIEP